MEVDHNHKEVNDMSKQSKTKKPKVSTKIPSPKKMKATNPGKAKVKAPPVKTLRKSVDMLIKSIERNAFVNKASPEPSAAGLLFGKPPQEVKVKLGGIPSPKKMTQKCSSVSKGALPAMLAGGAEVDIKGPEYGKYGKQREDAPTSVTKSSKTPKGGRYYEGTVPTKKKVKKGIGDLVGGGIGGLAGSALGGPVGAGLGAMAGQAIGGQMGKSKDKKVHKSTRGMVGAGLGGLTGAALGGPAAPVTAGLGAVAGQALGEATKSSAPKSTNPSTPSAPKTTAKGPWGDSSSSQKSPLAKGIARGTINKEVDDYGREYQHPKRTLVNTESDEPGWQTVSGTRTQEFVKSAEADLMKSRTQASMKVEKAIFYLQGYEPMNDDLVKKSFHGQIPDIMKDVEYRPPQTWWSKALSKSSRFDEDPVKFSLNMWYGESAVNKAVAESIGSKYGPQLRGEEDNISDGTRVRTKDLTEKSEELVSN